MGYDCITVKLRVPSRFNDFAFTEAVNRLLWQKLAMDPTQTGLLCFYREPAIVEPMFTANDIEALIRVEPGKVGEQKMWQAIQQYLTTTCGFPLEDGYVRDVSIKNDLFRTELGGR